MTRPTLLSLFSGGGLVEAGAVAAGYEPVGAVEFDPAIAAVYAANHGDHVRVSPVEDVDYRPWAGVYAVWASPSCKNASVANANAGEAPEDYAAAAAIVRCLRETRPQVFVLENVQGYAKFASFQTVLCGLRELGYRYRWSVENAANYAVPQTRKRLILRAVRSGDVPDLTATHCEGGSQGMFAEHDLLPWVGWYAAVEDLLPTCPESKLAEWQIARMPAKLETMLLGGGNTSAEQAAPGVGVSASVPPTRCVAGNSDRWRAVLVEGVHRTGGDLTAVDREDPSFTVKASSMRRPVNATRAVMVSNAKTEYSDGLRDGGDPALCTTSQHNGRLRAVLVDGQNVIGEGRGGEVAVKGQAEPALTVPSSVARGLPRAVLVTNQGDQPTGTDIRAAKCFEEREPAGPIISGSASRSRAVLVNQDSKPGTVNAEEPAFTIVGQPNRVNIRALLEQCRTVSMTPRCLARFQSVPDEYILPEKTGLACTVIGNGVACLLAKRIMESLKDRC